MARLIAAVCVLSMAGTCWGQAPEMPTPVKEHEALAKFAGEWETKAECIVAPGQEPITCEGTESAKMVGGFWLMSRGHGDMMGTPVDSVLTIGFDPKTKKYVGTFLCSADSTLWKYEGEMDASGKKLTLRTEGPLMTDPTKTGKYKEVLELVDKDHKRFTSYMIDENGKETKFVTMEYRRKK
jgi:hypothetical protein